jgi:hypothetical protein
MKFNLPKSSLILSLIILVIVVGLFFFFKNFTYYKNNQIHFGKPLLVVNGVALDEEDYKIYERILNGPKRYQQQYDKTIKLFTREEVLSELTKVTKMEVGAKKLNIYPTKEEIGQKKDLLVKIEGGKEKMAAKNKTFGWSESDFDRFAQVELVKNKLEDTVVLWREMEYVSLRFDILPIKDPPLSFYQPKAREFLSSKLEKFKNKISTKQIADELRNDPAVKAVFYNAIGFVEAQKDPVLRRLQRVTAEKNLELDKHVLGLRLGTKDDLWCTASACYLTRILAGNNGTYKSLEDWVAKQ